MKIKFLIALSVILSIFSCKDEDPYIPPTPKDPCKEIWRLDHITITSIDDRLNNYFGNNESETMHPCIENLLEEQLDTEDCDGMTPLPSQTVILYQTAPDQSYEAIAGTILFDLIYFAFVDYEEAGFSADEFFNPYGENFNWYQFLEAGGSKCGPNNTVITGVSFRQTNCSSDLHCTIEMTIDMACCKAIQ